MKIDLIVALIAAVFIGANVGFVVALYMLENVVRNTLEAKAELEVVAAVLKEECKRQDSK